MPTRTKKQTPPSYLNATLPFEERARDLVSRMTLPEKVSQMLHEAPSIPRLGIPAYNWWNEALHGVARAGRATVFPQAIALAATFDTPLVLQIATAVSDEARAKHHAALRRGSRGQYQGLTFWTPNINIFRDPRWGRGQETYGEDPFLTSEMGVAFVKGLQGNDPHYLKTAACAKHYAVHSGPEKLRHTFDARVSPKDLRETYLVAFERLVRAGVEAVMGAYNRTNGEVCCGSKTLLVDILREEWGFQGHVVSDCWAIRDFHEHHKVTKTPEESAALAVSMGCDLNCGCTYTFMEKAVNDGLVEEAVIDRAVIRLFTTRMKLGMFDDPKRVPFTKIPMSVVNCEKHRRLARTAASRSFVLLKNDKNLLPLPKNTGSIFLTGPMSTNQDVLLGNYYGNSSHLSTFLEGISGKVDEGCRLEYRNGCLLDQESPNPVQWAPFEAGRADVTIACLGISPLLEGEEGEAIASHHVGDRDEIGLPANQLNFLKAMKEKGARIVLVLTGGSPIGDPAMHDLADAIVLAWYPGEEGGHALADFLFGEALSGGRLPFTVPRSKNQIPPYEEYAMAGRTYRYGDEDPLYPFGFGLSYSSFTYSRLEISSRKLTPGESLKLTATLTNTGKKKADEVVQVYLSWPDAPVPTPKAQLASFRRVSLKPGESRVVKFSIPADQMKVVLEDGTRSLLPGRIGVTVGGCSPGKKGRELGAAKPLTASIRITK